MKDILKLKIIFLLSLALLVILNSSAVFAASDSEREDVLRTSQWHDGDSTNDDPNNTGGGSGGGGSYGGCQAHGPDPSSISKDLTFGSGDKERRVTLMGLLIADYGLTAEQAAGIVGNFMAESSPALYPDDNQQGEVRGPPTPIYAYGNAYGLAQWDGSRKRDFVAFAIDAGYVPSSSVPYTDAANYAYLAKELSEGYAGSLDALKQQTSAADAAASWQRTFEGTTSASQGRADNANQVLAEYKAYLATNPTSPVGGGGSCSSDITAEAPNIDTSHKNAFTGPLIENPTGVVLHWTAGPADASVDDFITAIKSNNACGDGGCSVQFYVKGDGTIYQLVDPINTRTEHAAGANSCCIGIEIGGTGADDLLNNAVQKQSVVNLVTFLVKNFSMQVNPDLGDPFKGILSHHILPLGRQAGKTDVGDAYHLQIIAAVRKATDTAGNTDQPPTNAQ